MLGIQEYRKKIGFSLLVFRQGLQIKDSSNLISNTQINDWDRCFYSGNWLQYSPNYEIICTVLVWSNIIETVCSWNEMKYL